MPTPREELARAIVRWEGGFQAQPQDAGNYVNGRLVGTMRGVTPAVLAAHRGVPAVSITEADMRSVTLEEAAEIGETRFYRGTGLDMLAWGPATAALVDVGWGSGPRQAVLFAQRLSGAVADGIVGPETVAKYANWIRDVGWEDATHAVNRMRRAFYALIIGQNPQWEIYRQGWLNRADWMLPGTDWWVHWAANMPPPPSHVIIGGDVKPVAAASAPNPPSKSRTAKAAATAAAGGAATMADKATNGGVTEVLTTAAERVAGMASLGGAIMWFSVGLTVAGAGYAVWRVFQDRKAPT
jgi:lysozyme family protein